MKTLNNYITEKLHIPKGKSFAHTFEELWDLLYKLPHHEYYLEDDDDFFEDIQSLPRINNLPGNWKRFNGWAVTQVEAGGNRELCDYGPEHEDAVKILEVYLIDLENLDKRSSITVESDDEYLEYLDNRSREIIYIAVQEQ